MEGSGMATSRCDAPAARTERGEELPDAHLPADSENTPELMAIIERQKARRRPDCPFISTGGRAGQPASTRAIAVPASGTSRSLESCGRSDRNADKDPARPRCSAATTSSSSTTFAAPGSGRASTEVRRTTSSDRISGEPAQNPQRTTCFQSPVPRPGWSVVELRAR